MLTVISNTTYTTSEINCLQMQTQTYNTCLYTFTNTIKSGFEMVRNQIFSLGFVFFQKSKNNSILPSTFADWGFTSIFELKMNLHYILTNKPVIKTMR
jgi:hypothetical protein